MAQQNKQRPLRVLASPARMVGTDNPYPELLYNSVTDAGPTEVVQYTPRRLLAERWDIVHIHWPELRIKRDTRAKFIVSAILFLAGLRLARWRGAQVIWTVHNPIPHNRKFPRLDLLYYRAFIAQVDGLISLTNTALQRLHSTMPVKSSLLRTLIRHGHYKDAYKGTDKTQEQCRSELGLSKNAKLVLCLGQVREEKRIDRLIETFEERDDPDFNLVVAGPVTAQGLDDQLTSMTQDDDGIQLSLDAVEPEQVSSWIKASDVVVVPYEIVNSGSAILPPSLGRCVIIPDCPGSRELRNTVDPGWIDLYQADKPETLFNALDRAIELQPDEPPALDAMHWDDIGKRTRDFYLEVITSKGHPTR